MAKISRSTERSIKTVAKGAGIFFIALIVSRALGYLTRMIIARYYGPSGYGLVYFGASVAGLLGVICTFGLPFALERFIPEFRVKKQLGKIKGAITGSLKLVLFLSIVSGALLFLFAPQISKIFFGNYTLTNILRIFSVYIPFYSVSSIFVFSTRGFKTVKYDVYSLKFGQSFITLIFVLFFVVSGAGVWGAAMSYTIAVISAATLSFYFLEKRVFPILKTKIKSKNITRELLKFSAPLMLSRLMWTLVIYIDTIMIGYFLNANQVGIYQAAGPTSQLMMVTTASITALFLPVITDLFSRKKINDLKNVYVAVTKWIFYVNLPFLFIFLLFSRAILNVFFGSEFVSGFLVLSLLSSGYAMLSISDVSSHIINLLKKTKLHFYNNLVSVVLAIILNLLLIPTYGINGAAIATASTLFILSFLRIFEAYYLSKIWPFKPSILKSLLAVVISGSITILIKGFLVPSLVMLFLLGIFFFIFYAFLLLIFRALDKEDVLILKSIEQKTGLRIEWLRNLIKKFTKS